MQTERRTVKSAREIQPPKQERSRRTEANILAATRELLKTKNLADIAISEITSRAGASVGSFYARFPDKIALLLALQENAMLDVRSNLSKRLDPENWKGASLKTTVSDMIHSLVEVPGRHIPVFKAAFFGALQNPLLAKRVTDITEFKVELMALLVLSKKDEIHVPNARAVAVSGARMIESVLQHRRIRGYVEPVEFIIPDARLCPDLTQMYLSYLGAERPASAAPRKKR